MNTNELKLTLLELVKNNENECVEFKEAKNDFSFDSLGKYFSALSNGANLCNKQYAWLIFGVDDKTHKFINSNYRINNLNSLKKEIAKFLNDNITFISIDEIIIDEKRVIMFKIPAAMGIPTTWKGIAYDRNDEETLPLNQMKAEQIKSTINFDWSRQIIENATLNDLDVEAIKLAREQYKKKNENKIIASEIDNMSDLEFLSKVRVLIDGKITRTALLLLGKEEANIFFEDFIPQITWKLQDNSEVIDYEHFSIPLIINIEKAKSKIRNLRYRYMVNEITLFPNEVDQYDNYILREILNNAIAHQDYRRQGRVTIIEMKEKLIFINEGNFIPQNIEKLLLDESYVPPYYRNPFLANAMVNLNMIDTAGSGIKRVFKTQQQKYFPMPDYCFDEENRVKVIVYGKILDERYTKILFEKTNLDIGIVMLFDKVQKHLRISKEQADILRKNGLIEGRYPNIFVSQKVAEITDEKTTYVKNVGFSNLMYKEYIIKYLEKYKTATREEIDKLLFDYMPAFLPEKEKKRKIRYILVECLEKKDKKIENIGTKYKQVWKLK